MNKEQDFEKLWTIKNAERIINTHAKLQKVKYFVGSELSTKLKQTTDAISQTEAVFKVFKRRYPFLTGALIGSGLTTLFFLALGGPEKNGARKKAF